MHDSLLFLKNYHQYLDQFISELEKYSDDFILENFLQ